MDEIIIPHRMLYYGFPVKVTEYIDKTTKMQYAILVLDCEVDTKEILEKLNELGFKQEEHHPASFTIEKKMEANELVEYIKFQKKYQ